VKLDGDLLEVTVVRLLHAARSPCDERMLAADAVVAVDDPGPERVPVIGRIACLLEQLRASRPRAILALLDVPGGRESETRRTPCLYDRSMTIGRPR